jgi:pyridoxal phosphate enzyme (YggS family)
MEHIAANLREVQDRISAACSVSGRLREAVELIAVSKTFPAELIREASDCGQTLFGESRQQEAEPKISELPARLRWHFIGRLQTNKIRKILPLFEAIHAVDSLRSASFIDHVAEDLGLFPKVFVQVNVGGEATKGGFEPEDLERSIDDLLSLNRLEVLGLMTIPPVEAEAEDSRKWFVELRNLRDNLEQRSGVKLPALSMGMSGDYEIAIQEGATHVRVGSAIFGKRAYRVDGELG